MTTTAEPVTAGPPFKVYNPANRRVTVDVPENADERLAGVPRAAVLGRKDLGTHGPSPHPVNGPGWTTDNARSVPDGLERKARRQLASDDLRSHLERRANRGFVLLRQGAPPLREDHWGRLACHLEWPRGLFEAHFGGMERCRSSDAA